MKILYAIQGTGNGHISRSKDIIKELRNHSEVEILVSESQHEVDLGYEVKYKLKGLGFTFGKKGGIDYYKSVKNARFDKLVTDIYDLPVDEYDMVVSDFEPISSWACRLKKKPCVSLSHQTSFLSPKMPRPEKINHFSEFIVKWYAPVSIPLGLHFKEYDSFIKTPVIREEIRNSETSNKGHYTVYLPSFDEKNLLSHLHQTDVKWDLFSKHYKKTEPHQNKNVTIYPISYKWFIDSFANCEGILCNAGFETPSEALYLGKKLFAIPMKGQYEQECNAIALEEMGINTINKIDENFTENLNNWIDLPHKLEHKFENNIPSIVEEILDYADKYRGLKEFDYSEFYKLNNIEVEENTKFNPFN